MTDEAMEWQTVPELVRYAASRYPDLEGLVDGPVRMTFAELAEATREVARAAIASGIEHGDSVAIWAPNTAEWVTASLGLGSIGAVIVPISTRFKALEAEHTLRKSEASVLFTLAGFLDINYPQMLRDALGGPEGDSPIAGLPGLREIVLMRGEDEHSVSWDEFLDRASDTPIDEAEQRAAAVEPSDVCDIIFTSGTTGRPKGAQVTHLQNLRVFDEWAEVVGLAEGDRYLIVNPFFHTFGYKAGILAALMKGSTMFPMAVFDVDRVIDLIERERISMVPGAPTLFQSILNFPARHDRDLSSLRLAVTGGSVVPVELVRQIRTDLGFESVVTAYGLTESSGVVSICHPDDDPETIATTVGRPISDIEVRVVDDDNVEVPRGEPGEVVLRGYNVMLGYINDPEETGKAIDGGGWLHTGDIGVMDERDYIRITDRKKDMYIVGGFNAYPAEIENIMLAHPRIAQVAVVGVPDDRLGEVGVAFVIRRAGEDLTAGEVLDWCRQNMANFKVPRHTEIVEELPLTPSGKVVKYELRDRYAKGIASQ